MNRTLAVSRWNLLTLAIVAGALAVLRGSAWSEHQPQPPLPSRADRAAFMQRHFGSVMNLHEAVIRGDLDTARTEARSIADQPDPPGLPNAAAPYALSMKGAAGRAANGEELEDVAGFAAAMLATCGDCHRAVGTMPALSLSASPAVGGRVGHMLAHKAGVDLMVEGLTVPSGSSWSQGAELLQSAPLRKNELPRDSKLTREILEHEESVHWLAERALAAADARSRIYVYSELLQSCASCHALHGSVWGPGKR